MRFHRLRAEGLIGIKSLDLDLDLLGDSVRTVAICAENGAGKTTTMQALVAGIYLTMPDRPGDLADQFRDRTGFIELDWECAGQRYRSLVKVSPRGKEAYLFPWDRAAGNWSKTALPETPGGIVAYVKAISDRFMPLSESLATWFTPQKRNGQFHSLDRREKKAFVRRKLNLERLLRIAQAAAERAAGLDQQINALTARLDAITSQQAGLPALQAQLVAEEALLATAIGDLQAAVDHVITLERQAAVLAQRIDGRTRIQEELGRLEADRQAKRERYEEIGDQLDAAEAALARRPEIAAATGAIPEVEAEIASLQAAVDAAQARLDSLQAQLIKAGTVRAEIAAKERERDALLASARQTNQVAIVAADAALRAATASLQVAQSVDAIRRAEDAVQFRLDALKSVNRNLASITARVDLVDKVGCKAIQDIPVLRQGCLLLEDTRQAQGQQAELENALEQAEDAVQVAEAQLEADRCNRESAILEATATLDAAKEARRRIPEVPAPQPGSATLTTAIVDLEDSLAGYPTDAELAAVRQEIARATSAMKAVQDRLAILRDLAAQAPLMEAAGRRIEELNRESAQIQEQGHALKARIEASQSEIAGFDQLAAEFATLQEQLAGAVIKRQGLDQDAGTAREAVGRTRGAIAALEALTAEATVAIDQRAKLLDSKAVWGHLAITFNRISDLKLDAAGPQVSALVNQLLEETFGTRFRIEFETLRALKSREGTEEVFDIRVIDAEQGTSALLADKSGGETVLISEALSLGLSLWSAIASGKQVETLIRDEADGALSADRVVGYFHMLEKAGRIGGFHRQFFVTHRQELQELADARLYLRDGVFTVG